MNEEVTINKTALASHLAHMELNQIVNPHNSLSLDEVFAELYTESSETDDEGNTMMGLKENYRVQYEEIYNSYCTIIDDFKI